MTPQGRRGIGLRAALLGWRGYAFALVVTAITFAVRTAIAPYSGNAPFLSLFMLPILLSAYFGRIGPGLFSLAISVAVVAVASASPAGAAAQSPVYGTAIVLLIVNGALICVLSEALHRARDRMRAAAHVFHTTLSSIGDAVIATDINGQVTFMNAEASRLTGWTLDEARNRPLDEVFRVVDSRHEGLVERPTEGALISGSRQAYSQDVWVVSRDGLEIPIEDRSAPIRLQDDQPIQGVVVVFRDASFRRAALAALARSETLNRSVLDSMSAHIAVLDRHGCIVATNEAWRRFALQNPAAPGVAPDRTGIGANYIAAAATADLRHPDSGMAVHDAIRAVIDRQLERFSVEYPCHAPWEQRWFMMSVTPLEMEGGGAVVSHLNITSRKLAESALTESEVRNRTLLEGLADGVLVAQDYRFVYANPALERMLGYGIGAFENVPFEDVIHAEHLGDALERFRERVGDGPEPSRFQQIHLMRRGGGAMWAEAHFSRVLYGGRRAVLGIIRDHTERRRAEEALRASNVKLQAAVTAGEMGVWTLDIASRELAWDAFTAQQFALPFPERRAPLDAFMSLVHGEDRVRVNKALSDVLHHAANVGEEFRLVVDGQGTRWVAFTARPEVDASGAPLRVVGVCMDVTRRRQSEEHQARTQRLEAIGTLAGGIAHDFNNLLAAIIGNARLLEGDFGAGHPSLTSVDAIVKASKRGVDLVRQILTFSRPTREELQSTALVAVVADSVRLLRSTLPAMIEITERHDEAVPAVLGDPGQLHQVVMNLVTNAAQAIEPGEIGMIAVHVASVEVDAALARTVDGLRVGPYVRLRVSDNGTGMDPEVQKRIFDPFFTTKPVGEGSGLGLAVVHGIVTRHRGAIGISSARGVGTSVDIYLPRAPQIPPHPASAPAPAAMPEVRGQHVLFVDDEEDLVLLSRRTLERRGYRVTAFSEPEAALEALRGVPHEFDLLVTDLSMPRMTGFDLARHALSTRPDLPVVLMSGYVRPEDEEKARTLGVHDVLYKPTAIDGFATLIDGVFADLYRRREAEKSEA